VTRAARDTTNETNIKKVKYLQGTPQRLSLIIHMTNAWLTRPRHPLEESQHPFVRERASVHLAHRVS
jgi:hypothetical protein